MKKSLIFLVFILASHIVFAQPKQTIKGSVIDKDTRQPLAGATLIIADTQPIIGISSDENGNFNIKNVPVGRHKIICSYLGFLAFESDNIILNSAKELVLNIELIELPMEQEEVVVKAFRGAGNRALNEAAVVSTRSFSAEETQRSAASANDPARMAMGFPGVQANRDSRSDIVIRGNSGIGLLWRLEGIDIPNPNHFARIGSSGGGLTVFSTSMLANSDFSTGAYPAEYGNSFSGVFDMKFRHGNQETTERTAKIGLLGLEYSQEGPISSLNPSRKEENKSRASYLVNYRYSTLGILNSLGLRLVGPRTDNRFQDLSFNLYFPSKNGKSIVTLFGIGGLSKEKEKAGNLTTFSERRAYNFNTNMGAVGLTHFYLLDEKSYLKTTVALMNQLITQTDYDVKAIGDSTKISNERYQDGRLSVSTFYSRKFNPTLAMKIGVNVSYLFFDFLENRTSGIIDAGRGVSSEALAPKSPFLTEIYTTFRYSPTSKLTFNAGLHAMNFTVKNSSDLRNKQQISKTSFEPRLNMKYQIADNQSFSLAYGRHAKLLPLGNYYSYNTTIAGQLFQNTNLDFILADHYIAAYEYVLGKGARVHFEAYYQHLKNIPVNGNYSLINNITGFADRNLESKGTAENRGVELSLEKSFEKGAFFTLSSSVYRSTYSGDDGKKYSTQYDSRVQANFIGGKEWTLKKNNVLQIGTKLIFNGGLPLMPIDKNVVQSDGQTPILDLANPFSERNKPYFRPDLRIAYRKNKTKSSYTLALDIQNVISYKNRDGLSRVYDPTLQSWVYRMQSGLVPIISYQVDF